MLRILRSLALVGMCVLTAPVLPAAESGTKDLDSARTQSRIAVEQAGRLSRDIDFNSKVRREGERALSAAGRAGRNAPTGDVQDGRISRRPGLAESDLAGTDLTPPIPGARPSGRPSSAQKCAGQFCPEIDEQALAKAREDIKALLDDPRLAAHHGSSPDDNDPRPLLFVSFSMPEDSLRSLLIEAARTGSPLVLRGLVENSMKRTVTRLGELLGTGNSNGTTGKPSPSLAIDPTLFERFDVDKVPAFVLPLDAIASCAPDGCPVPGHLKVAGDVSLAYALGVMAREASGTTLGNRAAQWRQRLEVRP